MKVALRILVVSMLPSWQPAPAYAGQLAPEFAPYLMRFSNEAKKRGIMLDKYRVEALSISFSFNLSDYNALAECNMNTLHIGVSESYWVSASDMEKEVLLFHELGHCLLGRDHDNGTMPISGGQIYKSVMNAAGNALMYRFPIFSNCGNNSQDCGKVLVFSPKSKNNFYSKFHKVYMDELFDAVKGQNITLSSRRGSKPLVAPVDSSPIEQAPRKQNLEFVNNVCIIPKGESRVDKVLKIVSTSDDFYTTFSYFISADQLVLAKDNGKIERKLVEERYSSIGCPIAQSTFSPDEYLSSKGIGP